METSKKIPTSKLVKIKPTVFPLGFSLGKVEGSLIIIDFIDIINGKHTIIESMALPLEKAAQLSTALSDMLENGKSEN